MATVNPTNKVVKKYTREIGWVGDTGDTFTPFVIRGVIPLNISVQVDNGTLTMLGSLKNDGSNPFALKDATGTDVALADGELTEISDRVQSIIPVPVGTGVTVTLVISR
jgi:hypothetical protein